MLIYCSGIDRGPSGVPGVLMLENATVQYSGVTHHSRIVGAEK